MRSRLYFLIVSHRNNDETLQCLRSISYDGPRSIVIVENSADPAYADTLFHLLQDKYSMVPNSDPGLIAESKISLLALSENRGYAHACNVALASIRTQARSTDYVLVLNNDITFEPSSIDILLQKSRETEADIVGPLVLYRHDSSMINSFGADRRYARGAVLRHYRQRLSDVSLPEIVAVSSLHGCCFLLQVGVLHRLGLLDETYFLYLEETDYFFRGQGMGLKYYVVRDAVVLHGEGVTTRSLDSAKRVYVVSNFWYFVAKNLKGMERLIGFGVFFMKLIPHFLLVRKIAQRCIHLKLGLQSNSK